MHSILTDHRKLGMATAVSQLAGRLLRIQYFFADGLGERPQNLLVVGSLYRPQMLLQQEQIGFSGKYILSE